MTEVEFLQDYRGVLTDEVFYAKGNVAHLSLSAGNQLADRGIVKLVKITKTMARPTSQQYKVMTIDQLRKAAKKHGIRGYGRMKHETLIDRLIELSE